jgi:hypothetical protein
VCWLRAWISDTLAIAQKSASILQYATGDWHLDGNRGSVAVSQAERGRFWEINALAAVNLPRGRRPDFLTDHGSMSSEWTTIWMAILLNSRSLFWRVPVLELLPPPRRIVVPPTQGVRVDFRRHPDG